VVEKLRDKLHQCVILYGALDEKTLKISQELDELIVIEQMVIKRTLCKGLN
jgi:hypothetical protein